MTTWYPPLFGFLHARFTMTPLSIPRCISSEVISWWTIPAIRMPWIQFSKNPQLILSAKLSPWAKFPWLQPSVSSAVLHSIQRLEIWSTLHVRKDENSQRLVAVARDALSRSNSAADDYASHSFTATTAGSKCPLHRHWAGGEVGLLEYICIPRHRWPVSLLGFAEEY